VAVVQHTYTRKQYIEQHNRHNQYREQHSSLIRKSADRALSLRGIPWHLPYNWGKSTEKTSVKVAGECQLAKSIHKSGSTRKYHENLSGYTISLPDPSLVKESKVLPAEPLCPIVDASYTGRVACLHFLPHSWRSLALQDYPGRSGFLTRNYSVRYVVSDVSNLKRVGSFHTSADTQRHDLTSPKH